MSVPIDDAWFAERMAAFGPFEDAPDIAVAVSGGADSVALTFLLNNWCKALGGKLVALSVNHGLRPEATIELQQLAVTLKTLGVRHEILYWQGAKPNTGVQAKARAARYDLMTQWCRDNGVLHLALAHHADDQAETFLMRLAKGSGSDGLAAMAAVRESRHVRFLRPLLSAPKDRLRATLRAQGLAWCDDPSNQDMTFERVRVRRLLAGMPGAGDDYARAANRMGRARQALNVASAHWLARHVALHPTGYARLDIDALANGEEEVLLRALGQLVTSLGGGIYRPDVRSLENMLRNLAGGKDMTLAGCRLWQQRGVWHVCREARNLPNPMTIVLGTEVLWDGRIRLHCGGQTDDGEPLRIQAMTKGDWRAMKGQVGQEWLSVLPHPVRQSLPVFHENDAETARAVPFFGSDADKNAVSARFYPKIDLSGGAFAIA